MPYVTIPASGNIYHNSKAWIAGETYEVGQAEHDQLIALGAVNSGGVADNSTGNVEDVAAAEDTASTAAATTALDPTLLTRGPSPEDEASP